MRDAPILVIDDDATIRETVADILADEGYRVQLAANGAEGLSALGQERPALILLDRWMPILDGIGFVQALRAQGQYIPIVAMTAAHDARQWAEEIKAVAILPKPFKLEALFNLVAEALRP
ncbi:MAG TPA: response regulator [Roseiflexaceae bacterium]|nr:response regulator [Roseiflexaceae bacterium]